MTPYATAEVSAERPQLHRGQSAALVAGFTASMGMFHAAVSLVA
jgi:hypothetical protein